MQIVIDIPDEVYQDIQARDWKNPIWARDSLMRYIHEGVVLPEHHGRLIDADELKRHKYHDNNRFENAVAVAQIDWADTIIEADKAESEDKE